MTTLASKFITGDGQLVSLNEIVNTYKKLVTISSPAQGKIQRLNHDVCAYNIICHFNTVDCDTLELVKTLKVYSLSTEELKDVGTTIKDVRCVSDPYEDVELASTTSENGRFVAKLKSSKVSTKDATEKQLLQIWERSRLLKTIDVSELDVHGSINVDPIFGSFVWSKYEQQDKLLYVCKAKKPKLMSYFSQQAKKCDQSKELTDSNRVGQYFRKQDWGECLDDVEHTIVAVLDASNDCKIITIEMDGFSLADSQWLGNNRIISVAYQEEPRRLGIIYCNNRVSRLVVHDLELTTNQPIVELKEDKQCFHNPRVNHDGNKFIYLMNPAYGTHYQSVKLFLYNFDEKTERELIKNERGKEKRDLFIQSLPKNCFSLDDSCILFTITDKLNQHIFRFNLVNDEFLKLKFPTTAVSILDFQYDIILACGSGINAAPTVFVAALESSRSAVISWHQIEDVFFLDHIIYKTWEIPTVDKSTHISGFLITPDIPVLQYESPEVAKKSLSKSSSSLPTIVQVHGGPHSNFINSYYWLNAFYIRLGLNVLQINYRGSTGVSQDYSESLLGNIGKLDVEDCMHALRHFVGNGSIDSSKLIIFGGSHGGFLACHLSCQEEFKFRSAVVRNPVVDLTSTLSTADIPDWALAEALGHKTYDPSWVVSLNDYIKLFECSPIFNCSKADVPTLMCLGTKDLRVKMFQGERWIDNLRARGVDTLCKVYEDRHQLNEVHVRSDFAITSVIWILTHL